VLPVTNGPCVSPSSSGSPSRGVSEFQLPSLYQFSAVDAASAVDYSKDIEVNDGVVNSPPPKARNLTYDLSPSPLCREKRALERCQDTLPSTGNDDERRGPNRRLRLGPHPCGIPVNHVPHPTTPPPSQVPTCVDALPLHIIVSPPTSAPSLVCRSESDRCLKLRRGGSHSSSMYELENVDIAPFETVAPVSEPTNKVHTSTCSYSVS
jgi:hypothetical protein